MHPYGNQSGWRPLKDAIWLSLIPNGSTTFGTAKKGDTEVKPQKLKFSHFTLQAPLPEPKQLPLDDELYTLVATCIRKRMSFVRHKQ